MNNIFAWVSMPDSRPADSYISYADGSVFIDFNHEDTIIRLIRISFDGYGCCNLEQASTIPMSSTDSKEFLRMHESGTIEQETMHGLIMRTINKNKKYIPKDALREYNLVPITNN